MTGVDIMILSNPFPAVQWISNVKYTYGMTSLHESMPLMPPLKAVTSLRYGVKKVHIQGELEYSAAQHRVSRSFGEQETPSYTIVNLRTGWNASAAWQLNAGIENILDRMYREHLDWGGIPRPGRNIYMNVVFKF
jgi:iron complex outermembrane receptor protein